MKNPQIAEYEQKKNNTLFSEEQMNEVSKWMKKYWLKRDKLKIHK